MKTIRKMCHLVRKYHPLAYIVRSVGNSDAVRFFNVESTNKSIGLVLLTVYIFICAS